MVSSSEKVYSFGGGHVAQEVVPVLSHLGFLGYRKLHDRNVNGKKIHETGLVLTNDLTFSLFYNF